MSTPAWDSESKTDGLLTTDESAARVAAINADWRDDSITHECPTYGGFTATHHRDFHGRTITEVQL